MKRNPLTLITGGILILVFIFMLFAFQVRITQVAVVTTFGKYSRTIKEPGLFFRMPYPINSVYKFDNRLFNFEKKFEQTTTRDARNVMVTVYVGWRIQEPSTFLARFERGDMTRAEQILENLVRDAKNGVIGQHPFGDFISPDPKAVQIVQIEKEMLQAIQAQARTNYGIEVVMLGIKQLGLPESITGKVFERMREERQRMVKKFTGEGEAQAIQIRADADRERQEILAKAEAQAMAIRGQGDAKAAESYSIFQENPGLAIYLFQLKALETSLKERTTLILDEQTPPFNMLNRAPAAAVNANLKH
jgi:modulator of FtsH protease HflC